LRNPSRSFRKCAPGAAGAGSNQAAAAIVACSLGLDGVIAKLLPEEKVDEIEDILKGVGKNHKVTFRRR
jgi:cation transport ATPase